MKNVLLLLFGAAVVGIVISNSGESDGSDAGQPAGTVVVAEAPAEPEAEPDLLTPTPLPPPNAAERAAPEATRAHAAAEAGSPAASASRAPSPSTEPSAASQPTVGDEWAEPATETPEPRSAGDTGFVAKMEEILQILEQGRRAEARERLTPLYLEARGSGNEERAERLRKVLDRINRELVWNPRRLEGATVHEVQPGDTFTRIGKTYGVNWRMIPRLNGMDEDEVLRVGQQLKVLPGPPSVIVWKSQFRLVLLMDGVYVKEYPIGIGKDGKTPTAEFEVDTMLPRPRWYRPGGGVVEYGDPENALGERWIGFADQPGLAGYGIHGNNDESSIGTRCSNGCIRMHNADVVELYDFVVPGTKVEIED